MHVAADVQTHRLGPLVGSPTLGEGDEESLVRRETVDGRQLLPLVASLKAA